MKRHLRIVPKANFGFDVGAEWAKLVAQGESEAQKAATNEIQKQLAALGPQAVPVGQPLPAAPTAIMSPAMKNYAIIGGIALVFLYILRK